MAIQLYAFFSLSQIDFPNCISPTFTKPNPLNIIYWSIISIFFLSNLCPDTWQTSQSMSLGIAFVCKTCFFP